MILGDPGSGKTTVLRYLALKYASLLKACAQQGTAPQETTPLPLLVRIADYAEYGLPKGKSLSDFLIEYLRLQKCPDGGLADLLTTRLAEGRCLILFDGLDEIARTDERRAVVRQIEEFVRRYDSAGNRFLLTSRVAGYRSAPLGDPFVHYVIQDMDETHIRLFLERWCLATEVAHAPQLSRQTHQQTARSEVARIMHAIEHSHGVRRLAANPLLLRILALIHRTGARLPQKRIELYRLASETLAFTWRIAQGMDQSELIANEYLTPLLSKLAYWLHAQKPSGIATEREVYDILGEEWANQHEKVWNPDNPDSALREDVRNFLVAVREHTGLFIERAPQRYGFMHLTFEEYYAARYLAASSRTRAALIREHLHDPHWNEPILLALGFVGMESSIESNELLETAILARGKDALYRGFTPSLYEDYLGRDYLFALRCLGDGIPVRPSMAQRLLKRLVDELLYQTGSARFWRYHQALQERLEVLSLSEHSTGLTKLLAAAISTEEKGVAERAFESLKKLGQPLPHATLPAGLASTPIEQAHFSSSGHNEPSQADVLMRQFLRYGQTGLASDEDIALLVSTLQDENNPELRQVATWSLGRLATLAPQHIHVLLDAFHDQDVRVRSTAILSFQRIAERPPQVRKGLLNALYDSDAHVRQAAVRALASSKTLPSRTLATLQHVLAEDADSDVRFTVALILGQKGQRSHELSETLFQALSAARSWSVRRETALLLAEMPLDTEAVIAALCHGLLDEVDDVRAACVEGLVLSGRRSPQSATAIGNMLVQALEDPRFAKPDGTQKRSAHEYAFNGLWLMVGSGEVIAEKY